MRETSPFGFAFGIALACGASLSAQGAPAKAPEAKPVSPPRWEWPDEPMNLKVLPEDTKAQKLRSTMMGFTRALGVRCSHCHVGEEGKPLSTYDFPSDKNPNKDRAREMLRMLATIQQTLAKIEPSDPVRVNMGCVTCHQGRPRPMTLQESLEQAARSGGIEAAVKRYAELREKNYGRGGYDFGERSLNEYGYDLMKKGDNEGAIAILRLNAEQFPASGNAFDSLAEAYLAAGRKEIAAVYYRKAIELDPENENALEKLGEIEGGKAKAPG
jgi:tetratricopeptide (TPR) repeat protein